MIKYKNTFYGIITGFFLGIIAVLGNFINIPIITKIINFLPRLLTRAIFGYAITPEIIVGTFLIMLLFYPILLAIVGLIIDSNKPKKKANKKNAKKKK